MKTPGEPTLEIFDWLCTFYEKALPTKPPKIPTCEAMAHAAQMAYDTKPSEVPEYFTNGYPKNLPKVELRKIVVYKLAKWGLDHVAALERYMKEEYGVNVVHQDGDYASKGKRIVTKAETDANIEATLAQAKWNKDHCDGTHETEDFNNGLLMKMQPQALIERHKLVTIPLPKMKK